LPCGNTLMPWKLDSTAKSSRITLSNDDNTVKKTEGVGHAAVCSNEPLTKEPSMWEVTVSGITKQKGDWVQFGVFEKSESTDFEKFGYGNSWAVCSGNYYGNVIKMTKSVDFNNKTSRCKLDWESGKFTVEGIDNKFKAECYGLQNKKLYAFVDI